MRHKLPKNFTVCTMPSHCQEQPNFREKTTVQLEVRTGPLLRNDNLGGKFQKGDLIFDTEIFLFMNSLAKHVFLTRHKLC